MNLKRIGRLLVCLVLVCCLIVQTAPVKTEATGAGLAGVIASASSVTVAAPLAVGASLIALGVMADNTNPLVFENVVNDAVDSLSAAGQWVADGAVELLRTVDEAGNAMYYAAGEMLEGLRSWFFEDGEILASSSVCSSGRLEFSIDSDIYYIDLNVPFITFLVDEGSSYYIYICSGTEMAKGTWGLGDRSWELSTSYNSTYSGYFYAFTRKDKSLVSGLPVYGSSKHEAFTYAMSVFGTSQIITDFDLSLGHIPTYSLDGTLSDDAFSEYMAKQIRFQESQNPDDPDGDESNYNWMVPLSLGAAGTVYAMTQAEQWLGSTPSDFSDYETVTDYTIVDSTMSNIGTDSNSTTVPFIIVDTTNTGGGTSPSEPSDEGETIPGAGAVTATLLQKLFGGISDKLDLTYTSIREIPELLKEFMLDVKTGFSELPTKFAEWFNNIQTSLELLVSGQLTIGQLLGEFLSPFIDAFKTLLQSLFAPSSDFISNKVNALTAKYPYLNTFLALGTDLKAYFLSLGTQPPVIYIDLGAARGSLAWGGEMAFIDLTWYAEYKPKMDAIVGGFIWLWLAWRVFLSLPGLIQGGSGFWGSRSGSDESPTLYDRLPPGRG